MISIKRHLSFKGLVIFLFIMVLSSCTFVQADEISDKQTIKVVQATLNSEGYECGSVDGVSGKKTKSAIERFQSDNDLEANGLITDELVSALSITEAMLKGVVFEDFVSRYNESVNYLNNISAQTGDPTIRQITKDDLQAGTLVLDDKTNLQVAYDERMITIVGLSLARETNTYDIPMVYELVSCAFAMDAGFSDIDSTIEFVGDFVEDHYAESNKMGYGIMNHEDVIFFTIIEIV